MCSVPSTPSQLPFQAQTPIQVTTGSLKLGPLLTPEPSFSLMSPDPASNRAHSWPRPSVALHQSRSYLVAPGPALPRFHSTVAPPPNGFTPTTLLSSGSGACPSAPLHQPRSYLVAPGPAPHAFALGHAPQRPKTNHALTQSLQAASPPLTHRFRRPAVPQMTFMFSKRMLLTRPLSMAPGNWASSACSTSRWVKSSSDCGCRRENLSP